MELISFDRIRDLDIAPARWLQWVEEGLRAKDTCLLPPKISLKPEGMDDVFYNTMPCIIPSIGYGGVKLVTRYPHRKPALDSQLMLYRLEDGRMLALMDATWITNARTGAVAAHSAALLGVPGFTKVGFMGLGNTARATMEALRVAVPDRELRVGLLRHKDQAQLFEERFSSMEGVVFHEVDTPEELIAESQVVVSCVTAADGDFATEECFKPGVTVIPVHTRGFMGCDLTFDKVYCDDRGHVKGFRNFAAFELRLAEVAEVLRGEAVGRTSDDERILVYNIGLALHDMVFAGHIYDEISPELPQVELEGIDEKFWA